MNPAAAGFVVSGPGLDQAPGPVSSHTIPRMLQQNVDPKELAKFSELAHKWWDPESEFRPLHQINPLRLGWIEALAGPVAGRQVLDVGCGGGILAEAMARRGAEQVTGIDLALKSLRVAQLHAMEAGIGNVQYREVAAEAHAAEAAGQYDVVTCMEMLEHVPDPAAIVAACAQACKPGGWVFFSTLNRNPKSFLFAIVGAEYVLGLLPRGTHEYARFLRPSELGHWCRDAGLDIAASRGMQYNPLTRRYWLSSDTSVNYLIACRKPAAGA
ncbi:MAG: Ubiquinone biosynthesis O-methyltransferase [Pseudomonadota bacterium]|jgi:2-polyprenyl-6-hydroxyphenyl methylase/3-demethylubiquinone-9 3-methyltransferase